MPKRRAETQLTKDDVDSGAFDNAQSTNDASHDFKADQETIKGRRILKARSRKRKNPSDAAKKDTSSGFKFSFGGAQDKEKSATDGAQDASKDAGFTFSFNQSKSTTKKDESTKESSKDAGFSFNASDKKDDKQKQTQDDNKSGFSFSFGQDKKDDNQSGFSFSFGQDKKDNTKSASSKESDSKKDDQQKGQGFAASFAQIASNDSKQNGEKKSSAPSEWNFSFDPAQKKDSKEGSSGSWNFSFGASDSTNKQKTPEYKSLFSSVRSSDSSWTEGKNYTPSEDRSEKFNTVELANKPNKSGEEDEKNILECPVKLFEMVDKEWKERGIGTLKLNEQSEKKARLIMRTKETHSVKLNARLFEGIPYKKISDKNLSIMLQNVAESEASNEEDDKSSKEQKVSHMLLRTKEANHITTLVDYIENHFKKE